MQFRAILAGALATAFVFAHPGVSAEAEAIDRRGMLGRMARNDLSHCTEKVKTRGLEARAVARRSELLSELATKSDELEGITRNI